MTNPEPPPRDPDTLPDSQDLSGPCPRCGRASTFAQTGETTIETFGRRAGMAAHLAKERVIVLRCAYCEESFAVVEQQQPGMPRGILRGVHWWPPLGAGRLSPDVPTDVASAYDEGQRCISASAPNGAVALFRTALSYIVEDKGSQAAKAKGDLKSKLAQMTAEGGPVAALSDWMTHVRLYGNAGAHPDLFGDVSLEEAQEVSRLIYSMIELLYLLPAQLKARQRQRQSTPPASGSATPPQASGVG
ncbi:MAG TPA: DUF4145 domain-containing protein [Jatrophihabitans sp.]|nr:DUF4145 domain-containing protein [Jatrophihabitans sp.]